MNYIEICPLCNDFTFKKISQNQMCKSCFSFFFYIRRKKLIYLRYYINDYFISCSNIRNQPYTRLLQFTNQIDKFIMAKDLNSSLEIFDIPKFIIPKTFDKNGLEQHLNRLLDLSVFS